MKSIKLPFKKQETANNNNGTINPIIPMDKSLQLIDFKIATPIKKSKTKNTAGAYNNATKEINSAASKVTPNVF